MKFNKKKLVIVVLVIITLLGIIIGVKKLNNTHKSNNKYIEERIYLTADEINEMISYIPQSLLKDESNKDAYYGNLVTITDVFPLVVSFEFLHNEITAYKIGDITDTKLKKILTDQYIKSGIYLKSEVSTFLLRNYNINIDSYEDNSGKVLIVTAGDKYIVFLPTSFSNIAIFTKLFMGIDSSYATKSSATIVEKTLFYKLKDNKYYVYKNSNFSDDNIIKTYDKVDKNGKTLSYDDIANKIKEDFKDYNYGFKHTYKKNDTGYYWYSTEFVEIDS